MPRRKTILISGASSGLGRGMAREFAARGRNLALCARRLERLVALRNELAAAHPAIQIVIKPLDVLDFDAVFATFRDFDQELGGLDRIIVNAGLGKGQPLGTGYFYANRQTAETNFVGALAQIEAAMELFRGRGAGHLVVISSVSALRGMPRNLTVYAASKAALSALAEGLRAELGPRSALRISTILPGYIRSEINEKVKHTPFMIDTETGCRLLVRAIEREPVQAFVPAWPWMPLGWLIRLLPPHWVAKFF